MKRILILIGIVLILASLISMIQYIPIYKELSEYQMGAILGKLVFLIVGAILVYFSRKIKVSQKND